MIEQLWTGESVWCLCGHHIKEHTTNIFYAIMDYSADCFGVCHFKSNETNCKCKGFKPYRKNENDRE